MRQSASSSWAEAVLMLICGVSGEAADELFLRLANGEAITDGVGRGADGTVLSRLADRAGVMDGAGDGEIVGDWEAMDGVERTVVEVLGDATQTSGSILRQLVSPK